MINPPVGAVNVMDECSAAVPHKVDEPIGDWQPVVVFRTKNEALYVPTVAGIPETVIEPDGIAVQLTSASPAAFAALLQSIRYSFAPFKREL